MCSLLCPPSESEPSAGAERLDGHRTRGRHWRMDVIYARHRATLNTLQNNQNKTTRKKRVQHDWKLFHFAATFTCNLNSVIFRFIVTSLSSICDNAFSEGSCKISSLWPFTFPLHWQSSLVCNIYCTVHRAEILPWENTVTWGNHVFCEFQRLRDIVLFCYGLFWNNKHMLTKKKKKTSSVFSNIYCFPPPVVSSLCNHSIVFLFIVTSICFCSLTTSRYFMLFESFINQNVQFIQKIKDKSPPNKRLDGHGQDVMWIMNYVIDLFTYICNL